MHQFYVEKFREISGPDEEIARLVREELLRVMQDLPAPTDCYVNRWDTYSPQRPEIQSPENNLFFIGDRVLTNHESVYMEKTNMAAKMISNLLLDKIGQKQGRIKILNRGKMLTALSSPYA